MYRRRITLVLESIRLTSTLRHTTCMCDKSSLTLCDPMDCSPPGSSVHEDSPGKNTRVGCHAPLQGIFSTQGSNPGLLHFRWILYHLSHQGSPIFWKQHSKYKGSQMEHQFIKIMNFIVKYKSSMQMPGRNIHPSIGNVDQDFRRQTKDIKYSL